MQVELYVTAGPAKGKHFTFEKPDNFLFGRAADAHISLPQDRYVSRQHFLLEISPPRCKLRDLHSKNGVLVNGVLYGGNVAPGTSVKQAPNGQEDVILHHGDEIVVGDTHIRVIIRSKPVSKPAAPPAETVPTCRECGRNAPANDRQQAKSSDASPGHADYVCPACREKQHREKLRNILQTASEQHAHARIDQIKSVDLNIPGYRFEHKLKHAGTGEIYKATHLASGRLVAMKLLFPRGDIDPYMKRAFHRELAIIRQLKHPNLVRFLDHGDASGILYCVFEYVDGYSLTQYITSKGGRLALDDAAPLWLRMLDGLAYAHRVCITLKNSQGEQKIVRGIVHRNLKPQNILLVQYGDSWLPKITDFGLAKSFESAGFTDITVPGDVLGTPVYWPREQITHYRFLNPASDVFAIAAVFYEMLTGSWVREGFSALFKKCKQLGRLPSISDYMLLIANHPPIPIREKDPAIPKPVADVLDRALQEEELPHDIKQMHVRLKALRYPDAQAFQQALLRAFQEIGLSGLVKAPPRQQAAAKAEPKDSAAHFQPPQDSSAESIIYSGIHTSSKHEVAMFLLDIVGSTQLIIQHGDTDFSAVMGSLFRRIRDHQFATDLMLLKSTGDGFLAVYKSAESALTVAKTYLEQPLRPNIHVRMALHWGAVNTGPDGNILGTEARRVFRVENIRKDQCLAPTPALDRNFSATDRILATQAIIDRLPETEKSQFCRAGTFMLTQSDKNYCDLWIWRRPLKNG